MIKLIIDGKEAVIKAGTSFKLTRMNPYFEDQGDFTFEVQLPLDGCAENLAIFGALHRAEVGLAGWANKELPMHLIAPPVNVVGVAKVMTVSEAEVKVQLLAGKSAVNDFGKDAEGKDLYIDELDLGLKLDNTNTPVGYQDPYDVKKKHLYVTFPVKDSTGMIVNYPLWTWHLSGTVWIRDYCTYKNYAVQPYLATVINSIIRKLGYWQLLNVFNSSWLKDVFVANNVQTNNVDDILPHWTVAEFFTELRNAFGVYLDVGESVKSVNLVSLSSHYSGSAGVVLEEVLDELTADIDHDENAKTTKEGNTEYELGSISGVLRLPDEVWQNAIIKTFSDDGLLRRWIGENIREEEKSSSKWLFVDLNLNRTYAYLKSAKDGKFYLAQVDAFPPLIRNGAYYKAATNREINTKLRIVPLQMTYQNFKCEPYNPNLDQLIGIPILMSYADSVVPDKQTYSVNGAINGNSESTTNETNKLDKLYVAFNSNAAWEKSGEVFPYKVPLGINYLPTYDGFYLPLTLKTNIRQPFSLRPSLNETACVGYNLEFMDRIKTAVERQFLFLDDVDVDPTASYVIKGKRYACHKIEVTIDTNGVQPLKRGYFYEIE
nr:MAG TPA: hypothetical protein [Caudoviricetes sp.]